MHPAFDDRFLSFFGQPPVGQCLGGFGVGRRTEDGDRAGDHDGAVFRIHHFDRLAFGHDFQDVLFQDHRGLILAGDQFVLDRRVAWLHFAAIVFQLLEIIPAVFVSDDADSDISRTRQQRAGDRDFVLPLRLSQFLEGLGRVFRFHFCRIVGNDHVGNTHAGPVAFRIFGCGDILAVGRIIFHQQVLFFQRQIIGRVGDHQQVGLHLFRFDFAGQLGDDFLGSRLEPLHVKIRKRFFDRRFNAFDDVRVNGSVDHEFAGNFGRIRFRRRCRFLVPAAATCSHHGQHRNDYRQDQPLDSSVLHPFASPHY